MSFCCFRFMLVNAGVIYVYFANFQSVDEEEYGGAWELTKEGFMTSFAGFLVRFSTKFTFGSNKSFCRVFLGKP